MLSAVQPAAGTQSIQASAAAQATTLSSGAPPARAPVAAHSRTQTSVDDLFRITADLGAELRGRFDSAESRRLQDGAGLQPDRMMQSLSEIKEKLDALRARAPSLGRFTDALSAEVDHAIRSGTGSNERLAEVVQRTQQAIADRYGFVGHLVNKAA